MFVIPGKWVYFLFLLSRITSISVYYGFFPPASCLGCCPACRSEAKFGGEHQEAVDALRMCISAHTARFGPMGDGMLQLLMDTRAGAALL